MRGPLLVGRCRRVPCARHEMARVQLLHLPLALTPKVRALGSKGEGQVPQAMPWVTQSTLKVVLHQCPAEVPP